MGVTFRGSRLRFWLDIALILTVFAAGSALGMAKFKESRGADGVSSIACPTTFFARSLMFAAGRGSFQPDIAAVPGLQAFLERRTAVFDPAVIPKNVPTLYDSAAEYHIYLEWTVAAIWSVMGISWQVLEPFLALALGLCGVFAYGLFRLGMNRGLSLAGTALFLASPSVLEQVCNMRDFSKAPFLLGGMFAIGWLVTRGKPVRFLWTTAGLMGLLAGVGMGFRQDAMILVPASLAAILFLSPGTAYKTRRRRIGAALVYFFAFLAAAAPMLTRMEGGAQPYHPLAQGYSMKHMDRCSLEPGVCEPLACSHDYFVFTTISSYARRATGNERLIFSYNSPEDARYTRDWVVRTALQFPADTIARGYGAALNLFAAADTFRAVLNYADGTSAKLVAVYRPIAEFFRVAGPFIAACALLAAAAADLRLGLALMLLTLYFCGYVSLDNEWRHTFHLGFVPFWAAGFLMQQVLSAVRRSAGGTAQWGRWLCRSGLFAVLALSALWVPWQAARLWQQHTLDGVLRQYASVPRSAVPTEAEPMQDWTLFRMKHGLHGAVTRAHLLNPSFMAELLRGILAPRYWENRCGLYAVRFRARPNGRAFMVKYWGQEPSCDFSQVMRAGRAAGDNGETWFFFPAYNLSKRSIFEGIAVPGESADDFLGLYRVDDKALPALLPCATVNEPGGAKRLTARIEQPYDPTRLFTPENEWMHIEEAASLADGLGRMDTAILCARAANAFNPSEDRLRKIAFLYEKAGDTREALRRLTALIMDSGGSFATCAVLEQFLDRNTPRLSPADVWEPIALGTKAFYAWTAYEKAVGEKDAGKHIGMLREWVKQGPEDINAVTRLQNLLVEKCAGLSAAGDRSGAIAACEEAMPLNAKNDSPVLCLNDVLSKSDPGERRNVWERVWKVRPESAKAALFCGAARAATNDIAGAKEAFAAALRLAPDDWNCHVLASEALEASGDLDGAIAGYGRALALNPGLDYIRGRMESIKERIAAGSGGQPPAPPEPVP